MNEVKTEAIPFDAKKKSSRIFIVPTILGFLFGGLTLGTLLFASIMRNESIYIFTFILITLGLLGMVMTNFNLRGITFTVTIPDWIYKDQKASLRLKLDSSSKVPHIGLIATAKTTHDAVFQNYQDVVKIDKLDLQIDFTGTKRGPITIANVTLGSLYPIGMFYAWLQNKTHKTVYVVPQPIDHLSDQTNLVGEELQAEEEETPSKKVLGNDLFKEHKLYKTGDKISRIDWKVTAKFQKTFIRTYESEENHHLDPMVRYSDCEHLGLENALEQMSFWLSQKMTARQPFGVELGAFKSTIDFSKHHYNMCLIELAKFNDRPRNNEQ